MESTRRLLRTLQYAMLASVVLYVFIGEQVAVSQAANAMFFYVLSFAGVTMLGVMLVMRRTLVLPSEAALRTHPEDAASLNRWRVGYIITYAMSEILALFGMVLRIIGFTLSQVLPFYIAAFVLLAFYSPRIRVREAS